MWGGPGAPGGGECPRHPRVCRENLGVYAEVRVRVALVACGVACDVARLSLGLCLGDDCPECQSRPHALPRGLDRRPGPCAPWDRTPLALTGTRRRDTLNKTNTAPGVCGATCPQSRSVNPFQSDRTGRLSGREPARLPGVVLGGGRTCTCYFVSNSELNSEHVSRKPSQGSQHPAFPSSVLPVPVPLQWARWWLFRESVHFKHTCRSFGARCPRRDLTFFETVPR